MINLNYAKISLMLLPIFVISCSSVNTIQKTKKSVALVKSDIRDVSGDKVNIMKVDAALNLSYKIIQGYDYYSLAKWDSLIKANPNEKNVLSLAKEDGIDYLIYSQINVLNNLVRHQINIVDVNDQNKVNNGIGYSNIKYIDSESGTLVYDPAIMQSTQRALAVAYNDSLLFVKSEIGMNVKPLPTLVIGSINFENKSEKDWEIFLDKEIASYACVETIFDNLKNEGQFVIYDTDTRDSAYKKYGFHIIENHTSYSLHELKVLYNLGVDYFISGHLLISDDSAELTLIFSSVEKDKVKTIREVKESFVDDSRMVLLEHTSRAIKKLFDN